MVKEAGKEARKDGRRILFQERKEEVKKMKKRAGEKEGREN